MNTLEIINLHFAYNLEPIIKGLNLSLTSGEDLMIGGPNASGKTSLLKLIAQIHKPISGEISLSISSKTYIPCRKDGFYPRLNGRENIKVFASCSTEQLESRIKLWNKIPIFDKVLTTKFKDMSIGMKQILNIFILTLHYSDLLLFDEPFKNLDKQIRDLLISLLKQEFPKSLFIMTCHEDGEIPWPNNYKYLDVSKC